MISYKNIVNFDLPQQLSCPLPSEERGLARDDARLLVTADDGLFIKHTTFQFLDEFLEAGDVLVVNTSATRPAALPILLPFHKKGMLHLSNQIEEGKWLVEIREIQGEKTIRWKGGQEGMTFNLPNGARVTLKKRFYENRKLLDLWIVVLNVKDNLDNYLKQYAHAIKYEKINDRYPMSYYQTFFSFEPGSSEMPSAARGFTRPLVDRLLKKGIQFAPILLHTGVSSLEEDEMPYPEYMEISPVSASIINSAKRQGKRIIAVGTTAIRAVESAANQAGLVQAYHGNTSLFIDQDYQPRIADGLLTGFHEPRASHLHMLQALASFQHVEIAYEEAIKHQYFWHVFGDLHLIL